MQQQYRSPKRRDEDNGLHDPYGNPLIPRQPGGNSGLRDAGRRTDQTLGDIDDVLAENAEPLLPYSGSPADILRQEQEAATGGGESPNTPSAVPLNKAQQKAKLAADAEDDEKDSPNWYNSDENRAKRAKKREGRFGRRKKAWLAGGIIAALLGGGGAAFFGLLPMQLNTFVEHLEARYMATTQQAVENESETLLTSYLRKYLFPGLNPACPSNKISRSCAVPIHGTGPVARLYDSWRQNRIENRLYTDHQIELGRNLRTGKIYMIAPGINDTIDLTDVANGREKNIFNLPTVKRSTVRQALKDAFASETWYKRSLMRWSYGKFIEKKYGIKRCLLACNVRDKVHETYSNAKLAFQAWLIRRIVEPRSLMLATVWTCFISDCNTNLTSDPITPDDQTTGEPKDDFTRQSERLIGAYSISFGTDKLETLVNNMSEFNKDAGGHLSIYLLKKVVTRLTGNSWTGAITRDIVLKVASPAGWVLAAAKLVNFTITAGIAIKSMVYVINSTLYVQTFSMLRTTVDEARSGRTDAAAYGSVNDALGDQNGPSASASSLYQSVFDAKSPSTLAFWQSIMPPKAYAQAAAESQNPTGTAIKCNDSKTLLSHEQNHTTGANGICPELNLRYGDIITFISDGVKNIPGASAIAGLGAFAAKAGALLLTPVTAVVSPIAELVIPQILSTLEPLMMSLVSQYIPNPLPDNLKPSGSRVGEIAIGGADESGNRFCHYGLGCKRATPAEAAAVFNEQQQESQDVFNHKPLFARMFDKNDMHSMVSQLALQMPGGVQTNVRESFASLISNPFGKIISSFASLLSTPRATAAAAQDDPFGITQYYYPDTDPVFTADPEDYWAAHCQDTKQTQQWDETGANNVNPDTGQPENDTTNPCLLIQTTTDSNSRFFTLGANP